MDNSLLAVRDINHKYIVVDGSEVLNMDSTIQVRVEDELKNKSDELFKDLGTDTTTAIRMFLTLSLIHI